MEEFAIELDGSAAVRFQRLSLRERLAAYAELTKPRITFLIVLTSAAGFALASPGRINYAALAQRNDWHCFTVVRNCHAQSVHGARPRRSDATHC